MEQIPFHISPAGSSEDFAAGRALMEAYARELGMDLGFQNFEWEMEHLAEVYGSPRGCLLLGRSGTGAAGCVGLRELGRDVSEMKRLYLRPEQRGKGLATLLATVCVGQARAMGYRKIVLDTLPGMEAAHRVYEILGFRPVQAYYENPHEGTRYLGLSLV